MNKGKSHIRPLLAGALRPNRRPPVRGLAPQPVLRLSCGPAGSSPVQAEPIGAAAETEQIRSAISGLRSAHSALNAIQAQLLRLDATWERVDQILESAIPSALNEAAFASEQVDIDATIASIEQIAAVAAHDGRSLLDGDWCVTVECAAEGDVQSIRLPRISAETLGSEHIEGFVASLRSDEDNAVVGGCVSTARAIVRSAMLQVAGIREEISRFIDQVAQSSDLADIAEANAAAAQSAECDFDFAVQVGRVTPVDALIAGKALHVSKNLADFFQPAGLRIAPTHPAGASDNS